MIPYPIKGAKEAIRLDWMRLEIRKLEMVLKSTFAYIRLRL